MTNEFAQTLNEFIKSTNYKDKIFVASILKELGKIGQRLYKLNPISELKASILKIKSIIENL